MMQRNKDAPVWLGQQSSDGTATAPGAPTPRNEAFADGELWIGQHSADQDILVFDPAEADPHADVLSLYSLSQHRMRSFPRATVVQRITPLTDKAAIARAKKDYARRAALRTGHEETLATARTELKGRQRDSVIASHRAYVEAIGRTYEGVEATPEDHRPGRRTKCHACGFALDDFAGAVCGICNGILCSCGRCACKAAPVSD